MQNSALGKIKWLISVGAIGFVLALAGCNSAPSGKTAYAPSGDGDVPVPSNYRGWAKFVPTIDKPNGQIREIYINDTGLKAMRGQAFPSGTVTVMEIYEPRKDSAGNPIKDKSGRLKKADLSKVFVMSKGSGWGNQLPESTIGNGDWLYGAYNADGKTPATNDFSACRACHVPLADKDFIARYDEHFDNR